MQLPPGAPLAGRWIPALLVFFLSGLSAAQAPEPVRLASEAFGVHVEIEVRDLPRPEAEAAIRAAIDEISLLERLTDPDGEEPGGLGRLNAAAGQGDQAMDPRLRKLLERAWDFCFWSRNAHGPLGADLYAAWGLRGRVQARPANDVLAAGTQAASCRNVGFGEGGTVALAEGSRAELWGFSAGYAVDRAMDLLRDRGATNAWVEVGRHQRGLGGGPDGGGWIGTVPILDGFTEPLDEVRLTDHALSVIRFDDRFFTIAGDDYPPFLDQRTGLPPDGIEGTLVVTDLAVDAQALATALLIMGNREGQMRLGGLKPVPAVLWLLGDGTGTPLLASFHWSSLRTQSRR